MAAPTKTKLKIFDSSKLDSRIHSANTQGSEKALGYFFGPCFVYMAYYAIAGSYLTQFYTDVLGVSGIFLTMMPLFSKIFDAVTNIIMGVSVQSLCCEHLPETQGSEKGSHCHAGTPGGKGSREKSRVSL